MASKKTYTINITYTTKSPHEKFASPQENNKTRYNNSTSSFGMNNSYSKPSSNWQGNSGKIFFQIVIGVYANLITIGIK